MARASEPAPRLEWRREMRDKHLNEYDPDEHIPNWIESVPAGPGQWYLDGEPISDTEAKAIIAEQGA